MTFSGVYSSSLSLSFFFQVDFWKGSPSSAYFIWWCKVQRQRTRSNG